MMEQVELIEKRLLLELKHILVVELLGKLLKQETLLHQQDKVFLLIQLLQQLQLHCLQEQLEMKFQLLIMQEQRIATILQLLPMVQKKFTHQQTT